MDLERKRLTHPHVNVEHKALMESCLKNDDA
jgi:hypothetical protein